MNKALSWTKALAIRGLILIGIVVLVILIINSSLFDEALDPEVEKIMAAPKQVSLDDNAYTALSGLTVASDRDPVQTGREIIAEFRRLAAAGDVIKIADDKYAELLGGIDIDAAWMDDYESLRCSARRELNCMAKLQSELKQKPIEDPRLQVMMERYKFIIEQDFFSENDELDFASQLPPYGIFMYLSKLHLAEISLNENDQALIDAIETDLKFWKLLLRDGKSLIAKMVGVAGIWNDFQFISELVANGDPSQEIILAFKRMVIPLRPSEHDISETFISEFRISLSAKNFHFNANDWLIRATYQENATLNEYYETFLVPIMNLSQSSAEDFLALTGDVSAPKPGYRLFPPTLYNLGGKILIHDNYFAAKDYVSRVHDLSGVISLVALQLNIESSAGQGIKTLVENSNYRNPYTNQAMNYDEKENSLSFNCVSPGNLCKVLL